MYALHDCSWITPKTHKEKQRLSVQAVDFVIMIVFAQSMTHSYSGLIIKWRVATVRRLNYAHLLLDPPFSLEGLG